MSTLEPSGLRQEWLERRYYADLDARAERALRAAGLSWQNEREAEERLAEARALAPEHIAVLIAHYRYYLYRHRFGEAERFGRACLEYAARALALPADFREVGEAHADFAAEERDVRFWMFALQAYGYVLLRCGRAQEGVAALTKLSELDRLDQTKTRVLLEVIAQAGREEQDC